MSVLKDIHIGGRVSKPEPSLRECSRGLNKF